MYRPYACLTSNPQFIRPMSNLITRAATGLAFLVVMIGCTVFSPASFLLLFSFITGMAVWEFSTLVNQHAGAHVNRFINTTAGVYLFLAFSYYMSPFGHYQGGLVFVPLLITFLFLPINELYLRHEDPLKSWAYAFASQIYVALPFALLNVMAFHYNAMTNQMDFLWQVPLALFIFIWSNDTGAYCVGSLLHKRFPAKLFERISPKKSWVGSIGGGVLCLAVAALLSQCFTDVPLTLPQWMGFALVVCLFGTWGDLVESMLKRQIHIKDSGNILPGHGGMLDRFDSALMAIPASVLYFYTIGLF